MHETLSLYTHFSPLSRGSMLLLIGLAVGSYVAALHFRLRHRGEVRGPRSCCPDCLTALGPMDLIPVISFLVLRGRCRYCAGKINRTYPTVEALCGLSACIMGIFGGWIWGGLVLAGWIAGAIALGLLSRRRPFAEERGVTLVEVLLACLLLTFVAGSVFEVINLSRKNALAAYQRTLSTGLAREAMADAQEEIRRTSGPVDRPAALHPVYDKYSITVESTPNDPGCYVVRVRVQCPTCLVATGSTVETAGVVCRESGL